MDSTDKNMKNKYIEKMLRNITVPLLLGILSTFIHGNGFTTGVFENLHSLQIPGITELNVIRSKLAAIIQHHEDLENSSSTEISENISTKDLFEFLPQILKKDDREAIKDYVHNNGLGSDPSSLHFIEREKNIRFLRIEKDGFVILDQDYFIQASIYNDFSGGYKRQYKLIPTELLMGPMHSMILHYIQYIEPPTNTTMLIQLQSSIIRANTTNGDITGQGIHTDGEDYVMLVCVERDDVIGAENVFHAALDGSEPLSEPKVIEAGDGVIFKDNTIYHYVSEASTNVSVTRRTVILLDYPDDGSGVINPRNKQGTRKATVQLRG